MRAGIIVRMGIPRRRPGATLPELIIVLSLFAILAGMTFPATTRVRNGIAVRAARDVVAGEIARASGLGRLHGSARIRLDAGVVHLEAPLDSARRHEPVETRFGVAMSVDGAAGPVALEFDALGLGRLANRTIRFRRGDAEAGLTLSTYGRPRRW